MSVQQVTEQNIGIFTVCGAMENKTQQHLQLCFHVIWERRIMKQFLAGFIGRKGFANLTPKGVSQLRMKNRAREPVLAAVPHSRGSGQNFLKHS